MLIVLKNAAIKDQIMWSRPLFFLIKNYFGKLILKQNQQSNAAFFFFGWEGVIWLVFFFFGGGGVRDMICCEI